MLHDRLWSILRPCVLQAGHATVKVVWHLEGLHLPPEPSIVQVVVVNVFAFHVQRGLKRAQDHQVHVELVHPTNHAEATRISSVMLLLSAHTNMIQEADFCSTTEQWSGHGPSVDALPALAIMSKWQPKKKPIEADEVAVGVVATEQVDARPWCAHQVVRLGGSKVGGDEHREEVQEQGCAQWGLREGLKSEASRAAPPSPAPRRSQHS